MVSLVKARKKAKERKAEEERTPQTQTDSVAEEQPVAVAEATTELTPEPKIQLPAGESAGAVSPAAAASSNKLEEFKRSANQYQSEEVVVTESVTTAVLELLLLVIENEQYALPIEKIIEIITPRTATRVPNAEEAVVGIISLRGTIVSILDIRRKLGHLQSAPMTAESRIIVVENDGETAGFLVDRVLRVVRVDPAELENHPVVTSSEQSEFIRGVFQHAQKLSILLDLERLLRF